VTSVRVMTWNVQNLFEPGSPDGPDDAPTYRAKIASLAAVIDAERPTRAGTPGSRPASGA